MLILRRKKIVTAEENEFLWNFSCSMNFYLFLISNSFTSLQLPR